MLLIGLILSPNRCQIVVNLGFSDVNFKASISWIVKDRIFGFRLLWPRNIVSSFVKILHLLPYCFRFGLSALRLRINSFIFLNIDLDQIDFLRIFKGRLEGRIWAFLPFSVLNVSNWIYSEGLRILQTFLLLRLFSKIAKICIFGLFRLFMLF